MQDYRKLTIWMDAMAFVEETYRFSIAIAREERYGLIDQLKRAAISIPLNIAEGAGCGTVPEFERFLWYAYRSVNEVSTCLELVQRLKLTTCTEGDLSVLADRSDKLSAMIYKFIQCLRDS